MGKCGIDACRLPQHWGARGSRRAEREETDLGSEKLTECADCRQGVLAKLQVSEASGTHDPPGFLSLHPSSLELASSSLPPSSPVCLHRPTRSSSSSSPGSRFNHAWPSLHPAASLRSPFRARQSLSSPIGPPLPVSAPSLGPASQTPLLPHHLVTPRPPSHTTSTPFSLAAACGPESPHLTRRAITSQDERRAASAHAARDPTRGRDAERGDTPRVQLHNLVERVRHQFARTLVIRSSRSRNRKAASRVNSGVVLEQDGVAGPSQQPDPGLSAPALPQESIVISAPRPLPLPLAEHLLVPAEHIFTSTLEVNVDEPIVEGYLGLEMIPEMVNRRTPWYVYRQSRRHDCLPPPRRANSALEADPDMMDQKYTPEDFAATSAAAAVRGPSHGMSGPSAGAQSSSATACHTTTSPTWSRARTTGTSGRGCTRACACACSTTATSANRHSGTSARAASACTRGATPARGWCRTGAPRRCEFALIPRLLQHTDRFAAESSAGS